MGGRLGAGGGKRRARRGALAQAAHRLEEVLDLRGQAGAAVTDPRGARRDPEASRKRALLAGSNPVAPGAG